MTHEEGCKVVIAALTAPMRKQEIINATGIRGAVLGNILKTLLRTNQISRAPISRERFCYYPGNTAPGWVKPEDAKPKPKLQYRVPVKRVEVFREYFGEPRRAAVTLPAGPWEAAINLPVLGECGPAQPGYVGGAAHGVTRAATALPLTRPGALNPLPANGGANG